MSQGLDQRLDAGGDVGMGSADPGGDPPWVSLGITSATADNRDAARHLELGGSFTVAGTTYTLAGFCDDEAYLNVQ